MHAPTLKYTMSDTTTTTSTTTVDLNTVITEQAQTPASTSIDGMSVSSRSLADLITAAKYLKSQTAGKSKLGGVKLFKIKSQN